MDTAELELWGPLSFPIYYGRHIFNLWRSEYVQLPAAVIGTSVVLGGVAQLAYFLWNHFARPSTMQRYCHAETGSWALVTGGSDGIGRGFVDELLERGFNVLLHGRNEAKLTGIQAQLQSKFPRRKVDYVIADASKLDDSELRVLEKVQTLPGKLTVLVNNVGGIHNKYVFATVEHSSKQDLQDIINTNITFSTHVTRTLLPELKKNSPALVINAGSMAGDFGLPMIAVYSGTKAYISSWTKGLKREMMAEKSDVEVMGLLIGNTISNTNKAEMRFGTITSAECAKASLDKVGSGETLVFPHWAQAIQVTIMTLMPDRFLTAFMTKEMSERAAEERKEK